MFMKFNRSTTRLYAANTEAVNLRQTCNIVLTGKKLSVSTPTGVSIKIFPTELHAKTEFDHILASIRPRHTGHRAVEASPDLLAIGALAAWDEEQKELR